MKALSREKRLHEIYDSIDLVGFGVISPEQFFTLGTAMHPGKWSEEKSESAFEQLDLDGDGFISRTDFVEFYKMLLYNADDDAFENGISTWVHSADEVSTVLVGV